MEATAEVKSGGYVPGLLEAEDTLPTPLEDRKIDRIYNTYIRIINI